MSNSHGITTSPIFIAATVLCAAGLLTVPSPAQAKPPIPLAPKCDAFAFPATFRVNQNDFWLVTIPGNGKELQGVASASGPGGERITGLVVGGLTGINSVDFTINWDNGHRSRYTGAVQPNGNVTGGRQDVRAEGAGPDNTRWGTETPLLCTKTVDIGQTGQTGDAETKTATVLRDTSIYPTPGGGAPYKDANGEDKFKSPGKVQLVPPELCREDNWCHVVGAPQVPEGEAWIYIGDDGSGPLGTNP
jgi:hypothetical protein